MGERVDGNSKLGEKWTSYSKKAVPHACCRGIAFVVSIGSDPD